jgi:hypothetical protein
MGCTESTETFESTSKPYSNQQQNTGYGMTSHGFTSARLEYEQKKKVVLSAHNFPRSVHNFQRPVHNFPRSVHNFPRPVHNFPRPVHNFPRPVHNFPRPVHNFPQHYVYFNGNSSNNYGYNNDDTQYQVPPDNSCRDGQEHHHHLPDTCAVLAPSYDNDSHTTHQISHDTSSHQLHNSEGHNYYDN